MTYATVNDVGNAVGRYIDPADPYATAALETATAMVQEYIGRDISRIEDDVETIDGSGTSIIQLTHYPVETVTTVTEDGETLTSDDFEWSADGYLRRIGNIWNPSLRSIVVTYTHGYDPIPDSIRYITATAASRILDTPSTIKQESIGGYSVTYTAGPPLQAIELATLERYRSR